MRTMAHHRHYAHKATRNRALYHAASKMSRVLSALLLALIVASLFAHRPPLTSAHDDDGDDGGAHKSDGNAPFWMSLLRLSGRTTKARAWRASEMERRHRPPSYLSPALHTGPWLIALIADLDRDSCHSRNLLTGSLRRTSCARANVWLSYLKRGVLTLPHTARDDGGANASAALTWLDERPLPQSRVGIRDGRASNRGMELSEAVWFHGRLLTPDDRTGALLEVTSPHGALDERALAYLSGAASSIEPSTTQQAFLADGDGTDSRTPFKAEWMVVKDDQLVVGGHGRPFTDARGGAVISDGPTWVKVMDAGLNVSHEHWDARYDAVAREAGVHFPGYLMHEAVLWSAQRREWVFLPRRRSVMRFDEQDNQRRGWNAVIIASEDFGTLRRVTIDGLEDISGLRGFSTAKFVPGSDEQLVVALRTVEVETQRKKEWVRETGSYLSVFDLSTGQVVFEEQKVSDFKYEGLVFL